MSTPPHLAKRRPRGAYCCHDFWASQNNLIFLLDCVLPGRGVVLIDGPIASTHHNDANWVAAHVGGKRDACGPNCTRQKNTKGLLLFLFAAKCSYLCMYVCMYVRVCMERSTCVLYVVCMCLFSFVCMYLCMQVCMRICLYSCIPHVRVLGSCRIMCHTVCTS